MTKEERAALAARVRLGEEVMFYAESDERRTPSYLVVSGAIVAWARYAETCAEATKWRLLVRARPLGSTEGWQYRDPAIVENVESLLRLLDAP